MTMKLTFMAPLSSLARGSKQGIHAAMPRSASIAREQPPMPAPRPKPPAAPARAVQSDDDLDGALDGNSAAAQARRRERARCAAIMGCAAAAQNLPLAAKLAFGTRMTRKEAIVALEAAASTVSASAIGQGQSVQASWAAAFAANERLWRRPAASGSRAGADRAQCASGQAAHPGVAGAVADSWAAAVDAVVSPGRPRVDHRPRR